jgi:predicted nucleic acid-binding Zn ribbon protein
MPLYHYACKKCKYSVEIIRTMKESEDLPTEQEITEECSSPESTDKKHDLERLIKSAPGVMKGGSWGNGKGYW